MNEREFYSLVKSSPNFLDCLNDDTAPCSKKEFLELARNMTERSNKFDISRIKDELTNTQIVNALCKHLLSPNDLYKNDRKEEFKALVMYIILNKDVVSKPIAEIINDNKPSNTLIRRLLTTNRDDIESADNIVVQKSGAKYYELRFMFPEIYVIDLIGWHRARIYTQITNLCGFFTIEDADRRQETKFLHLGKNGQANNTSKQIVCLSNWQPVLLGINSKIINIYTDAKNIQNALLLSSMNNKDVIVYGIDDENISKKYDQLVDKNINMLK